MPVWRMIVLALVAAIGLASAHGEPELYDPEDIVPDTPYEVRGWLEHGRFLPSDLLLDMKLDSGALTSSINAEVRGFFTEDGQPLNDDEAYAAVKAGGGPSAIVEFVVENEAERRIRVLRPVVRWAYIKGKTDNTIQRPVVIMEFCISGLYVKEEVNLSERDHLNYPVLIGRNMLKAANILVDSRESYTYKSRCERPDDS
ncbi:MAG: RimK/LysX family protein [Pseudomonadota bacterium]